MSERWYGRRITERSLIESVYRQRRLLRVEKVVNDETVKDKSQKKPIDLKAPKPAFLEPLC